MKNLSYIRKKLEQIYCSSCFGISCLCRSTWFPLIHFYRHVLLHANRFSIELSYFLFMSVFGYIMLISLDPRAPTGNPRKIDVFFTSVSAITSSSMSTVEMEVFSDAQLMVMTFLMFIGGEIFTSMVGLHFQRFSLNNSLKENNEVNSSPSNLDMPSKFLDQAELGVAQPTQHEFEGSKSKTFNLGVESNPMVDHQDLKDISIKFLGFLVLGYLMVVNFLGVVSVYIYISVVSSAKNILKQKGLKALTFSLFTIASTFANCGFVPTNENMIVFRKNSGLLLILIPQVLLGNTLFPPALRFCVWVTGKFTRKAETSYLLKDTKKIGYHHFFPRLQSLFLVPTVIGFIVVQFILFSAMEWNSDSLSGLNIYQKFVGVLFQTVNTRHAGENIVDLSALASAVLVLFVVMMYLPPHTSFLRIPEEEKCCQEHNSERNNKKVGMVRKNLIFSQLSYLVIFVILVCITERKKIKEDPLNFNVLNIVVEITSAYGNVGYTTGYNCDRRLKKDGFCENKWFGFVGKWSDEGKMILIIVMIFGRLKKFNMNGGKAWKLLYLRLITRNGFIR